MIEQLKATLSAERSKKMLEALGSLTGRDLFFFSLGCLNGLEKADASFQQSLSRAEQKCEKAGE